jgi:TPP-dependent pyruvate/acetoin dehydrogenase alpha subunit
LVGNVDGVCAGIGSSQHLCDERFISNGQQGGLLPVAAGIALDRKLAGKKAVVVSFIGEGTLGEGAFYETANITSLWNLPHLVVCENNGSANRRRNPCLSPETSAPAPRRLALESSKPTRGTS